MAEEVAEGEGKTAATKVAASGTVPAVGTVVKTIDVGTTVSELMGDAVKDAVVGIKGDPAFKEMITKAVLDGVREQLSGTRIPDSVRGALPTPPGEHGNQLIPRAGGPAVDTSGVDPSLQKMVTTSD
jgi:hypothetical protein